MTTDGQAIQPAARRRSTSCPTRSSALSAFILAYVLRFQTGLVPVTKGYPPFDAVPRRSLPFIAVARAVRLLPPGPLPPAARPLAGGRLLRGVRRQHPRRRVRHVRHALLPDLLRERRGQACAAPCEVSQVVWAIFLVLNVMLTFASRELMRAGARAPLARRHRPQARPDRRRRRTRTPGGRPDPRAPGARATRSSGSWTTAPAAITWATAACRCSARSTKPRRSRSASGSTSSTSRCRSTSTAKVVAAHRQREPRVRGHQGGAGPAAVHRAARAARGPGRRPDHQHQRRPAAGLQQRREAGGRHRALGGRRSSSWRIPLAIVALLVRLTSPGPVFYRQERMGLDGASFTIYKFRSMFHDAERETGPVWARDDDPRCTPIGRFLRRFDLDELPQIWNVLQGRHVARRPAARAAVLRRAVQAAVSRSTCCATR